MTALIPILAVAGFFTMIILLRSYTNKERMSMIEKGADPSQFKGLSKSHVLVFAGLAIGAGIGLLIATILESTFRVEDEIFAAMIFIFGGLGLIFGRKMANKEDN